MLARTLWMLSLAAAMLAGCGEAGPGQPDKPRIAKKETLMPERKGLVTMKGNPLTLVGSPIRVGDAAPDFTAVANDLSEARFSQYRGKIVILSVVPSLDTGVCSLQTRRFNQEAAALGDNVVILTISMDLPFAQKRWCGAEGWGPQTQSAAFGGPVQRVITLSDHRDGSFGLAYGVLIKELRLLARSVFVVGPDGHIVYQQLVPEMSKEPDYDAALASVRRAGRP